tara:strand:- start:462 stop:563 length:102 start_codon:yes stop_codon:yes gene_type:complete
MLLLLNYADVAGLDLNAGEQCGRDARHVMVMDH